MIVTCISTVLLGLSMVYIMCYINVMLVLLQYHSVIVV